MKNTKISWCTHTFNVVTGCYHTCPYCYARRMTERFSDKEQDWLGKPVHLLDEPVLNEDGKKKPYPYGFEPTFHRYRLGQVENMKNWKPSNIFICSMADLFGWWVPDEWLTEIFEALRRAPMHNYLFLTKNPMRYCELEEKNLLPDDGNFWYGTTVTRPDDAYFYSDERKTFLSVEPILEDFGGRGRVKTDWVIIGAETGNRRDKVVPEKRWIDGIIKSCDEEGVPVFLKESLIPVVGEENMRQEMPEGLKGGVDG